jgi:hypothetical protein
MHGAVFLQGNHRGCYDTTFLERSRFFARSLVGTKFQVTIEALLSNPEEALELTLLLRLCSGMGSESGKKYMHKLSRRAAFVAFKHCDICCIMLGPAKLV